MKQPIEAVEYDKSDSATPDFSVFVTNPPLPPDVALTNGSDSFGFHKFALRRISPVFCDILDGDMDLSEINVGINFDIKSLEILQRFVYTKPQERRTLCRNERVYSVEVIGSPFPFLNGIYLANGKCGGVDKFVNEREGKTYEISRVKAKSGNICWWISRTDVSPDIGLLLDSRYRRTSPDRRMAENELWGRSYSKNFAYSRDYCTHLVSPYAHCKVQPEITRISSICSVVLFQLFSFHE